MSRNSNWNVARLDEIERRGRDIPVREHLGIHAFGMNAYTPAEDGTLISEHDESGSGQEELYLVLDGNAVFEVDGKTVDAPSGTFVFVRPESRRKATGDGTVLAIGATPGEAYQALDWGDAWPFHRDSMTAYSEQRYADALDAVRAGLEHAPENAGLHYNLRVLRDACGRQR
jgi:mannose-6-phosphate isomerase-like protein (cupin superfamily)